MIRMYTRLLDWWDRSRLNHFRLGIVITVVMILFMASGLTVEYPRILILMFNILVINFVLYGMVLMGLNLQYGYAGIVNFGPVLFFGVGAYSMALVSGQSTIVDIGLGAPWYVGAIAAIIVVTIVAVLLALSTIQLRHDYLAIVTLAAAEIFHQITRGAPSYFGGGTGVHGVPTIFRELAADSPTASLGTFIAFGGMLLVTYALVERLGESPYGRVLRAIQDDEDAIRTLGKNSFRYKFTVFVIGSIFMGLSGILLALQTGTVAPGYVSIKVTLIIWIGMLIGGAGNNRGVLLGLLVVSGLFLTTRFAGDVVPIGSRAFASVRFIIIGLLLVFIIRYRPEGILSRSKSKVIE